MRKETEMMELKRKSEAEINKEKCKSMIFKYLFANQGKNHIKITDVRDNIPRSIVLNLSEQFNDFLTELLEENKINGKTEGDLLVLY
jgi:hypothetical protein